MKGEKEKKQLIFLILVVSICLIPAYAVANDHKASPIWSDTLGNYSVLVACSDDGLSVIAGSDSGLLKMYDRTGKNIWTYQTNGTPVTSVSISGNAEKISATTEGKILIFGRTGDLLWDYNTDSAVGRAALSHDGDTIVASGDDTLYLFDSLGNIIGKNRQNGEIWNVAVSDDGRYGAAAVDRGWRERKGEIAISVRGHPGSIGYPTKNQAVDVGVSADGSTIVGIDYHNLYSVFRNGTSRWNFTSSPPFKDVAITPDGKNIVTGSQYYLRFFNDSGDLLWEYQETGYVGSVAISGDGGTIVAGSSDRVRLFDKSGIILWDYDTGVSHVSAARNGNYFAVGTGQEIMFFNRWGNGTIVEDVKRPDTNNEIPLPSPSSTPAPLPAVLAITAIVSVVFFTAIRRRPRK